MSAKKSISKSEYEMSDRAVNAIRAGKVNEVLEYIYASMFETFLERGQKRFRSNLNDLEDVFQEMVTQFYLKTLKTNDQFIQNPRLEPYLYGAWNNLLNNRFKKKRSFFPLRSEDFERSEEPIPEPVVFPVKYESVLEKALSGISKTCREMLKLIMYQNKTIDEIAVLMQYANVAGTRVTRTRCMNDLKQEIKNTIPPDMLEEIIRNL